MKKTLSMLVLMLAFIGTLYSQTEETKVKQVLSAYKDALAGKLSAL